MKFKKIGEITVDAGIVWIGDPCYVLHKDLVPAELGTSWGEFCDKLNAKFTEFKIGVCAATAYGDGSYPVYAVYDFKDEYGGIFVDFNDMVSEDEE